jgi:outer membrane protein
MMINKIRSALAVAFGLAALATSAAAQPAATQPKPAVPTTPTTQSAAVPSGKVALILSAAFQDPKQGIARFTVLLNKLNAEFQKVQDDLNATAQRIKTSQDEITKLQSQASTGAPVDLKSIQVKIDQLDTMKKDYQRRGEDAQAQYGRRRQELFAPLQDDVGKALDAFAKARGITLVIDASQTEGILFASEGLDITRAFISDYNQKNPATAAATPPKP